MGNEPQCFVGLGHVSGEHAPGNIMSCRSVLEMAHHVMMAHGHVHICLNGFGGLRCSLFSVPCVKAVVILGQCDIVKPTKKIAGSGKEVSL